MHEVVTIGIDCSTNPSKLGLSRGLNRGGRTIVEESRVGESDPVALVSDWINYGGPCLLAIDAPLGWPEAMGDTLAPHKAGKPLNTEANNLFRRYTDKFIKEVLNKQPLDVGSNLIARTAHFALNLLEAIREQSGMDLPMAWNPNDELACAVIEVYPAATLEARGLSSLGYKKLKDEERRRDLIDALSSEMVIETNLDHLVSTDDTFDAAICLLAASDFLNGKCFIPGEERCAQVAKESWIWVKKPDNKSVM